MAMYELWQQQSGQELKIFELRSLTADAPLCEILADKTL
jgi:hypothetical protein